MFSKSVNTQLSSILDILKVLAAYALAIAGVFFYQHMKGYFVLYVVLFFGIAIWMRASRTNKNFTPKSNTKI